MPCPAENTLLELAHHALPPSEAAALDAHLDGCPDCRELVAGLLSGGGPSGFEDRALPTSVGRYQVQRLLGAGGMGVVYEALDPSLGRQVAIKVLHARGKRDEGGLRLLREAQAMARLSHQNVVAVHDVGTVGDQVFVAMERVDGGTLADWLASRPRSWREVAAVFAKAGQGLRAAHEAGLVHRDFKPENVLVGAKGEVRVTDFGLAGASDAEASAPLQDGPAFPALTRSGARLGTPRYMAPEQFERQPADARTDQFSFCVALYEALFGQPPFEGGTVRELTAQVCAGAVREPPKSQVPRRLRSAVLKGLARHPAQRHASLEGVLDALTPPPRRWLRGSLAAAALLLVAVAVIALRRGPDPVLCASPAARLAGIWDAPTQAAVRAALLKARGPHAEAAFQSVRVALDAQAKRWSALQRETCEAGLPRAQDEELLWRRMLCLAERREEMGALTALLSGLESREAAQNAVLAVRELTPADVCADARALVHRPRLPVEPAVRAKVAALRGQLADAKAQRGLERLEPARVIATRVREEAKALGQPAVEAEALYLLGKLAQDEGSFPAAEPLLDLAAATGEGASHDELVARSRVAGVWVVGVRLGRTAEGHRRAQDAAAAITRLGGSTELEGLLAHSRGGVLWREGKTEAALAEYRSSAELLTRALGEDHPEVAMPLSSIAQCLRMLGRYAEGIGFARRALALREETFGPEGRNVASSYNVLGTLYGGQGQLVEAQAAFARALAIQQKSPGSGLDQSLTLQNLGWVARGQGRLPEALDFQRRALAIREARLGPESAELVASLSQVAGVLSAQHRCAEAIPLAERALALVERVLGPEHPSAAGPLMDLGECWLAQGAPRRSVSLLERALALREKAQAEPRQLADARFVLAQALVNSGGDGRRARVLAEQARDAWAASPGFAPRRERAEAWLARQRR